MGKYPRGCMYQAYEYTVPRKGLYKVKKNIDKASIKMTLKHKKHVLITLKKIRTGDVEYTVLLSVIL